MAAESSVVPKFMTKDYLQDVLRVSFEKPGLKLQDYSVKPASAFGDGYTCIILRITVKYISDGEEHSMSIIGKYLPKTDLSDELTKGFNIFKVETEYLMKAWPRLVERYPEANYAPKAYHLDEENQVLYMEDCCASGYVMVEAASKGLDIDHSKVLIQSMGKMHAYTYKLLQQEPQLKETFDDFFWKRRDEPGVDMQLSTMGLELMLEKIDKWTVSDDLKERLRKLRDGKIVELGLNAYARKETAFNVLAHGDVWANNVMFKYDDKGKVLDAKILDFQFTSYNSIGLDLNFLIFSSMDETIQMHRVNELFQVYRESFLEVIGPMADFTMERIWKEFHDRLGFGFIVFFIFRAGIIGAPVAFDLDALTKGVDSEINRQLFQSDRFIADCCRMLPYFAEQGLI